MVNKHSFSAQLSLDTQKAHTVNRDKFNTKPNKQDNTTTKHLSKQNYLEFLGCTWEHLWMRKLDCYLYVFPSLQFTFLVEFL